MSRPRTPLTVGDLREIAKHLNQWERRLVTTGGEFKDAATLVTRIEVHRPDEPSEVIGHFVLDDGWVGFLPKEWDE